MLQNAENLLTKWAEVWSSHETNAFLGLFAEDCVYEDVTYGAVNRGKAELRTFVEGTFAVFPDFHIDLKSQLVAGEWAAMEWVMSGTHKGDLPGMPATNKKFSIRGASVAELEGAKIKRISDYWDLTAFLKQVGLMPSA